MASNWTRPGRLALLAAACLSLAASTARGEDTHVSIKEEDHLNQGLDAPPAGLDRSTPFKAWSGVVRACREGNPEFGAHVLNLGDVPEADRKQMGASLVQQLCSVLRATSQLKAEGLDDTPAGPILDEHPTNFVKVAKLQPPGNGKPEELWLRRSFDKASEQHLWVATRYSVSLIPAWYQQVVKKERTERAALESLNAGLGPMPPGLKVASPRDAVSTFLDLHRRGEDATAARLIDLTGIEPASQPEEGRRLARRLAILLRQLRPEGYRLLSNDALGAPEKDVKVDEERVAAAEIDGRPVDLLLVRHPTADGKGAWLFSDASAATIDPLYALLGYGWAGDVLPPVFFEWQLWGVQLWQWLGLFSALVLAVFIGWAGSVLARKLLRRLAAMTRWEWDDKVVALMRGPLAILFWVLGVLSLTAPLALDEAPRSAVLQLAKLVAILAAGWLAIRLIDVGADSLAGFFKGRRDDLATSMVPVFRKVLKPIVGALVFIFALQNAGMNVAGLLAGLGIGGLAIALAGKPALENLFGSIAIAFDQPFKIGDFVKVGEFLGTVEDVGLRSTRLRTLDRSLVTIPNGQMADAKVENLAMRDRFKLVSTLGVQYDTSMDQLRLIIDETKRFLLAHPKVQPDFSVRFIGFGESALQIELFLYVLAKDWGEFTGVREGILMDVGGIIERAGTGFAFPTRTLHIARKAPGESDAARRASSEVTARKEKGELCVPEIPAAVREFIQNQQKRP